MSSTPGVVRSTAINLIGQIIPTVISLITVPLYLHWIGEVKYGVLLLAFTMLGYFGAFDFGLGRALAQRVAGQEDDAANNRTFWTAAIIGLAIGVVGGLVLLILGHLFFAGVFRIPVQYQAQTVAAIPWLAATVPLVSALSILTGALQAKHAFVSLNVGQALGMIGLQIFPLVGVALGHATMPALVASALLGRLVGVGYLYWSVSRVLPLIGAPRIDRHEIGPLLRFGGWISLSSVLIPLLTIVDRMVIGTRLGAAAVTAYTIPFSLTQKVSYLPMSLATTLFPRFSQLKVGEGDVLLRQGVIGLVSLQSPIIVVGILLVPLFFQLWLGDEMATKTVPVAVIMLVSIWINGPAFVPNVYMPAQGRPDLISKFYLSELLPFLGLLWVMVEHWGIVGAAIAWAIRSAADAVFCFVATTTLSTYWKAIWPNIPAVAVATWLAFNPLSIAMQLLANTMVVVASCISAWLILPSELRVMVKTLLNSMKHGRPTSK